MSEPDDIGARIAKEFAAICAELPKRLDVVGILRDANARLVAAAGSAVPAQLLTDKVVEVLREIATIAVEEFTKRTGQPFLWTDDGSDEPEEVLMSFGLDDKGNLVF
jgi:hypothetical protein